MLPGAILTSSEYGNLLKVADNQLLSLPVMLDFAQVG